MALSVVAWLALPTLGLCAEAWLDAAAPERRVIYLDGSDLKADVAGAELQLRFSAAELPLGETGVAGLRALWGRDGSVLAVNVDYADPAAGVVLRLRAPLLEAGGHETIHLYYGGPVQGADPAQTNSVEVPADDSLSLAWSGQKDGGFFSPGWISVKPDATAVIEPASVPGFIRPAMRAPGDPVIELPLDAARQTASQGWTIECLVLDDQPPVSGSLRGGAIVSAWAGEADLQEPVINFGMIDQMMHTDTRDGAQGAWFGAVNTANDTPREQWITFAAVYDVAQGSIRTYRNGEFVSKGRHGGNQFAPK